jgi:hypothetical protein
MKVKAFIVTVVIGSAACAFGQATVGDQNPETSISPVDAAIGNVSVTSGASPYQPYEAVGDAALYIKSLDPVVNFTQTQKQALAEIFSQRNKELEEVNKRNAEKIKAASDLLIQTKDTAVRDKAMNEIQKATQELQEAYAPMHAVMKKYNDQVENVFTAEQKRKVQDWQLTNLVKNMAKPVELTEQQLKVVKDAANVGEGKDSYPPMVKALNDVMTAAQKAKFNGSRAVWLMCGEYRSLNLTVEQVATLHQEAESLAKNLSLNQEELAKRLSGKLENLLTAEQKKAFEQQRKAVQSGISGGATEAISLPANPG